MALPDVAACKRVLKREDSTVEDTLIAELLARAIGLVQGELRVVITAAAVTMIDRAVTSRFYSNGPPSLVMPRTPFDPDTVAITDAADAAIDTDDLLIDAETGIIRYLDDSCFENGPYTITADVGLSAHSRYAEWEPILSAAIVDTVADLYYRRTPSLQAESAASGISRTYAIVGLPARVREALLAVRQSL